MANANLGDPANAPKKAIADQGKRKQGMPRQSGSKRLVSEQETIPDSVLAISGQCAWISSADGRQLQWIDRAAENVFGRSDGELLSQPELRLELIHDDDRPAVLDHWRRLTATGQAVTTVIAPLTTFYVAETYHQKHMLQNTPLMAEMKSIYPDDKDWIDSTAAARLNGYLGGYGRQDAFERNVRRLGLSGEGESFLRQRAACRLAPLTGSLPR